MSDLPIAGASNPGRTYTDNRPVTQWTTRSAPPAPYPAHYVVSEIGQVYKGFKVAREGTYLHWRITGTEDGKQTPRALQGNFTQLGRVKTAIDDYLLHIGDTQTQ